MSTDTDDINIEQDQLKLDMLNNFFGWIDDAQTKATLINKYYTNKEHREALKTFLDDMLKALDESTAEDSSKEETKRQLSYIT
jgi:phage tail tube protein FII